MKPNLDTLKGEIEEHLETEGFSIFHGYSRLMDTQPLVFWDTERYPDYKLFVKSAKAAGAKIMIVNQREFSSDVIDDAVEQLAVSELPSEEQRNIERRLKEMRVYEGFTCSLEVSFDYQGRVYLFDIQTEWYEELTNILDDLEFLDASSDEDDEDDESAIGGYFSKN
jgi:hypothetical protein